MATTLYNCPSENCAAYCAKHYCHLTVKQIRHKDCLQKQCRHLRKNEEHEWWAQRERTRQKREARKQRLYSEGV